ncbi:MAG: PhoX family phosphatase [Kiloniellales bacterium]
MTDWTERNLTRAEAFELSENQSSNTTLNSSMGDIVAARLGRRGFLKGALAVTAVSTLAPSQILMSRSAAAATLSGASFQEIEHGVDERHHVAPGYKAEILIRWGDKVTADAPDFDPMQQTAAAQSRQFGYNNDFIGFVPLPLGSDSAEHGLLCINHEYTNEEVMFPGVGKQGDAFADLTREQVDIEQVAHGCSVLEVKRLDGKWQVVPDSSYARRITTANTYMDLTGPAAGHDLMKTPSDPAGASVIGTVNNCAGGITPWGTYLTAEENFHGYFWGTLDAGHPNAANFARYGVPGNWYGWGKFYDRFDINAVPNEANRFGWVVEIDPSDPTSVPKKRTALGRFKHEGAETLVNPKDGKAVIYMGDDQRFDYVYRFVSDKAVDPNDPVANRDLLESGTLSVARYDEDGSVTWLPLIHGQGKLTAENGFADQGEVMIKTRLAADLLGATKMDRPEDIEANRETGQVFVMLTNNTKRGGGDENAANPRAPNSFGHIVEMIAPDGDHTAERYSWDILVKCGNPANPEVKAVWNENISANGWFASPDNCVVSPSGVLWVSTDQGRAWSKTGTADGLFALGTEGAERGLGRMFFRVPVGAELCGPRFTPDGKTLFLAVQHPATDGVRDYAPFGRKSTFEDPATRWPDFSPNMPPRPSVVVVTKEDGGTIGS